MRRALLILCVLAVTGGAFVAAGAGEGAAGKRYEIVFDNAFGLVEDADFKVGGVIVGAIEKLDVERASARARVTVKATDTAFGGLTDRAECSIRPQSLIGEYFVDCRPGTGSQLADGATIPVQRTESPIPADLVTGVMRLPYRQRFTIIFNELGAGLAARGDDLDETIRRSIPALKETDRVLKVLADNRRTMRRLARDSGRVLEVLGDRRRDVGRFVTEAKDLAVTTAERRGALAETFRRFPAFLDQLEPTMRDLGTASRRQAPALADLRAAAPSLERLLATLRPFSRSLEPAVESLGEASKSGRTAVRESADLIEALGRTGEQAPEVARNAALTLGDLDDRSRAVEPDPDSPEGKGYTGLEALLQYPFDQTLAINIFDQRGYLLKLNALINECTDFTDQQEAREDLERYKRCSQGLGPNQPGITTPDPSPPDTESDQGRRRARAPVRGPGSAGERPEAPAPQAPGEVAPRLPRLPELPKLPDLPPVQDLLDRLGGALDPLGRPQQRPATETLLDFLLAP